MITRMTSESPCPCHGVNSSYLQLGVYLVTLPVLLYCTGLTSNASVRFHYITVPEKMRFRRSSMRRANNSRSHIKNRCDPCTKQTYEIVSRMSCVAMVITNRLSHFWITSFCLYLHISVYTFFKKRVFKNFPLEISSFSLIEGRVGFCSNERAYSVESSLQSISSNPSLWKRTKWSVAIQTWFWRG